MISSRDTAKKTRGAYSMTTPEPSTAVSSSRRSRRRRSRKSRAKPAGAKHISMSDVSEIGLNLALCDFVIRNTIANGGSPISASQIGGSFLIRKEARQALVKTGQRLIPYLAQIFSLWRKVGENSKPRSQRETYVAHASATFLPSKFTLLSRPGEHRTTSQNPAGIVKAKDYNDDATENHSADVCNTNNDSREKSDLDRELRLFIEKETASSEGCVSLSKIGGAFFSCRPKLLRVLHKTGDKLSTYLSRDYCLYKSRKEPHELFCALEGTDLPPHFSLLSSRQRKDALENSFTGVKSQSQVIADSSGLFHTQLRQYVNKMLSEQGGKPVTASRVGGTFFRLHPELLADMKKTGKKFVHHLGQFFSLWKKKLEPGCANPVRSPSLFVARANADLGIEHILCSRPARQRKSHEPDKKPRFSAKIAQAPTSTSENQPTGYAQPKSGLRTISRDSTEAKKPLSQHSSAQDILGSTDTSIYPMHANAESNTSLSKSIADRLAEVLLPNGADNVFEQAFTDDSFNGDKEIMATPDTFGSLFSTNNLTSTSPCSIQDHPLEANLEDTFSQPNHETDFSYLPSLSHVWSNAQSQDISERLGNAVLSTDMTREDMAQVLAALLAHYRSDGSFMIFADALAAARK